MTENELEAIRSRAAGAKSPDSADPDPQHDCSALLAYVDQLHGVIHDLRQEPGYELGRRDRQREVVDILAAVPIQWDGEHRRAWADSYDLARALNQIKDLGPPLIELATDDIRRCCGELQVVLLTLLSIPMAPTNPANLDRLARAQYAARRVLDAWAPSIGSNRQNVEVL